MMNKKLFYQYERSFDFNEIEMLILSDEFKNVGNKLNKLGYTIKPQRYEYEDNGFMKSERKLIITFTNLNTNSKIELHFIKNSNLFYIKFININDNTARSIMNNIFKCVDDFKNNKNRSKEMTLDEMAIWFNENWFVLKDLILLVCMFVCMFGQLFV